MRKFLYKRKTPSIALQYQGRYVEIGFSKVEGVQARRRPVELLRLHAWEHIFLTVGSSNKEYSQEALFCHQASYFLVSSRELGFHALIEKQIRPV